MSSILSGRRRAAAALLLAAASAGTFAGTAGAGAGAGEARGTGPVRCEIRVARSGGGVALTALAHADARVAGTYSLRVSGSGTNIRQGGPFEAKPDRPATLGSVTLGGSSGGYRAELELDVAGETISCSKRIDDAI